MDRLHALMLLLHAKDERDALRARIKELEGGRAMTTRLRGTGEAMRKLRHELDAHAAAINEGIAEVSRGAEERAGRIKAELDDHRATLAELDAVADELKGSNLPPEGNES